MNIKRIDDLEDTSLELHYIKRAIKLMLIF